MSKKIIALHIIAAIFILLFFIGSRMPAYIAFKPLAQYSQFVTFGQASGTLWQGTVSNLAVRYGAANINLGYTQWEIHGWKLLAGKLALTLKAEQGEQQIAGDVELGLGKTLVVRDAEVMAPAAIINQFYPVPGLLEGHFEININTVELAVDKINALDATAVYKDARYTLSEPVDLGTFAARLSMEKETVRADLSDVDARVGVNGYVLFTPKSREFDLDVKLLPQATANPVIAQALASFFPQSAAGDFQVRKRGQL